MTGDADHLLRVVVADIAALESFILERVSPIAQVEKTRSSSALNQVLCKTALPLGRREPCTILNAHNRRLFAPLIFESTAELEIENSLRQ
jgi:hypothetical protein